MMWFSAVVVTCVISGVVSVVDVRDNELISGESLQDLITRTKKSSISVYDKKDWNKEDQKRTWNESPNVEETSGSSEESGEVSAEMTALLAEDIKEKIKDLKELENYYSSLKYSLSNRKTVDSKVDESLKNEMKSILESKVVEVSDQDDDDSLRVARQYNQLYENGQVNHGFYGGGGEGIMNAEQAYLHNGRFQELTHSSMNIYGDKGNPYLAQYNPSARTYEAGGYGGNVYNGEKKEHQSLVKPLKQLKQIIPNVINALAEITTPVKPVETVVSGGHPPVPVHKPIKKPEYVHKPPVSLHQQDLHKKPKGIGLEPVFFSKQIIFGIGSDKKLNTKNYYGTSVPQVHSYPQYYSYYPSGYSQYSPTSYWAPHRDDYSPALGPEGNTYYPAVYALSPDSQVTNYDPSLSNYPQGNAFIDPQVKTYYPIDSNYNTPYIVSNTAPVSKNDENIDKDLSKTQLLMESLPRNTKTQSAGGIESEIQEVQKQIQSITDNLGKLSKTTSNETKEEESASAVKRNPAVFRRDVQNEESADSSKVNKLRYRGQFNEKTGQFDFVEFK